MHFFVYKTSKNNDKSTKFNDNNNNNYNDNDF